MFSGSHPKVECRQQGEYVSLDKGNQHIEQKDENRKEYGNRTDQKTPGTSEKVAENKDQAHKNHDNEVTGHHVGK